MVLFKKNLSWDAKPWGYHYHTVDGWNPAPVEGFSTIPGGDRRISKPSTVVQGWNLAELDKLMVSKKSDPQDPLFTDP